MFSVLEIANMQRQRKEGRFSFNPFKRQSYKIVKHSNNSSAPTNCLRVFDHFMGLALKGLGVFLLLLMLLTSRYLPLLY